MKRLCKFLFITLLFNCAKKVPPPGKGEFSAPEIDVLKPSKGDTIRDTLYLSLFASDSSGLNRAEIRRGKELIATIKLKGIAMVKDTSIVMDRTGEGLFPDTIQVWVYDRWDNIARVDVDVFTFRKKPLKPAKGGIGDEGGENNRSGTPSKSP